MEALLPALKGVGGRCIVQEVLSTLQYDVETIKMKQPLSLSLRVGGEVMEHAQMADLLIIKKFVEGSRKLFCQLLERVVEEWGNLPW